MADSDEWEKGIHQCADKPDTDTVDAIFRGTAANRRIEHPTLLSSKQSNELRSWHLRNFPQRHPHR